MSIWDTASAAIDAAFAVSVSYAGPGLALDDPIPAIREDPPAGDFMGGGDSTASVGFEIKRAALPRRPKRGDLIGEGAKLWRVIEVRDRDWVSAWFAMVEAAA